MNKYNLKEKYHSILFGFNETIKNITSVRSRKSSSSIRSILLEISEDVRLNLTRQLILKIFQIRGNYKKIVRHIIEGMKQKQVPAVIIYGDFSKAFDSVDRSKMELILEAYGIPNEITKVIIIMYNNTRVFVRSPDGDTELFGITAGVLQGDTFAPYHFIIVHGYELRNLDQNKNLGFNLRKQQSRRYPAEMLTDADFADDLALLSDIIGNAEKLLNILEIAAASFGLHRNTTKTKFIAVNTEGTIIA